MRDRELYARILGIAVPWTVTDVFLDTEREEVRVMVSHESGRRLCCPECGRPCAGYDTRERRWRHLDTCQYRTMLVARVPRVDCPEHGVRQVLVPWAEPGSRFTALFEALAIDWLKEASIAAVARLLRLTWDEVDGVMARAVRRGLARRQPELPTHIGIDETAFQKRHEYVTVVSDQARGTVVHVADGRGSDSLDRFYEGFASAQKEAVRAVAMDMWEPYISSTRAYIPQGG